MTYIKLRRYEYFNYIKILTAFGLLSILSRVAVTIMPLEINNYFTGITTIGIIHIIITNANLLVQAIATAYYINLSEKRRGVKDKFWPIIGFLFGLIAFLGYVIWGVYRERQLIPVEDHTLLPFSDIFKPSGDNH